MSTRTARWIAWFLVGLYIILAAVGLVLHVLTKTSFVNIPIPALIVLILLLGIWPVIGALIVSRHPRNPVGWLLCTGLTVVALDIFGTGYVSYDRYIYPGVLPGAGMALFWNVWSGMPFAVTAFTLMTLLFPDGRPPSPGWRRIAWTAIGALIVYLPLQAVEPGPITVLFDRSITNPLAVSDSLWDSLKLLMWLALSILVLCNIAALISLVLRLRRAHGEERQQVKWLVFPAAQFTLGLPFVTLGQYEVTGTLLGVGVVLHAVASPAMVIATALAIFKYRLYDIDLIINRTLVYGALTGTLTLIYFTSVALLQQVFPARSPIAIVLSTLAIAALFSPLRRRIQNAIDRRFYRSKYDAERTLTDFAAVAQDEVEIESLSETVLNVVDETVQPTHVSLWLMRTE